MAVRCSSTIGIAIEARRTSANRRRGPLYEQIQDPFHRLGTAIRSSDGNSSFIDSEFGVGIGCHRRDGLRRREAIQADHLAVRFRRKRDGLAGGRLAGSDRQRRNPWRSPIAGSPIFGISKRITHCVLPAHSSRRIAVAFPRLTQLKCRKFRGVALAAFAIGRLDDVDRSIGGSEDRQANSTGAPQGLARKLRVAADDVRYKAGKLEPKHFRPVEKRTIDLEEFGCKGSCRVQSRSGGSRTVRPFDAEITADRVGSKQLAVGQQVDQARSLADTRK